jgi:DNA-binding PadR family transcriptional regulator
MMRDIFLGFIRVHLLHHASCGPVYGAWFIEELRRHGYEVSPGTLYPVLRTLAEAGYLSREDQVVDGKVRKYYTITSLGRQAQAEAWVRIQELVAEIMEPGPGSPESDHAATH